MIRKMCDIGNNDIHSDSVVSDDKLYKDIC